ncbi:MAG TPA: transcription antitermination factor NusB [Chitinophagaceae bacterium]|nr:transcription antitermination factor NusB [Chitinophagaceae bacterium]HAN39950.1 transcription antitermination factor NusB [Chitinophagaceae bacterium]
MISRRNIRVKVMQVLYSLDALEGKPTQEPVKLLRKQLDASRELFVYLLYIINNVALYAEKDAKLKASKNLPSYEDLHVNTKISGNTIIWKVLENDTYRAALENDKPLKNEPEEQIRKIYQQLVQTEIYKKYIAAEQRDKKSDTEILKFIFTDLMLPNEDFVSHIEEHYTNWDDDAEMMNLLMLNYLQKPGSYNLTDMVSLEKWLFAKNLLSSVLEKHEYLMSLIKPKLKNWDADRIAILDMLMIQMGVSELLYFETIPTKVTINEYIDLAKDYSTQQSGQFINGILDNIHKELLEKGAIQKIDFKQKA